MWYIIPNEGNPDKKAIWESAQERRHSSAMLMYWLNEALTYWKGVYRREPAALEMFAGYVIEQKTYCLRCRWDRVRGRSDWFEVTRSTVDSDDQTNWCETLNIIRRYQCSTWCKKIQNGCVHIMTTPTPVLRKTHAPRALRRLVSPMWIGQRGPGSTRNFQITSSITTASCLLEPWTCSWGDYQHRRSYFIIL